MGASISYFSFYLQYDVFDIWFSISGDFDDAVPVSQMVCTALNHAGKRKEGHHAAPVASSSTPVTSTISTSTKDLCSHAWGPRPRHGRHHGRKADKNPPAIAGKKSAGKKVKNPQSTVPHSMLAYWHRQQICSLCMALFSTCWWHLRISQGGWWRVFALCCCLIADCCWKGRVSRAWRCRPQINRSH